MKLHIEKPIYGGAGLARTDGKAVFVPFTLSGETVEAHIVEDNRGYATAEIDAVLEPAASRTPPPCPYFGECGGCHYQHADYPAQVEMKITILRESLERARIAEIPAIVPLTGEPFGYRNRVRLHVQKNPFALCYKRRNSHSNLPVATCPIAAPVLQQTIDILNREGQTMGLADWATEVELFTNADASAVLLSFQTALGRDAQHALQQVWPRLREHIPAIAGAGIFSAQKERAPARLVAHAGQDSLRYAVADRSYRVSLGSFFQVNRFLLDRFVQRATSNERGGTAWDLYAGVGLFSLPLTESFADVIAVESSGAAIRDLRENLRNTRHRIVAADTAAFLQQAVVRREAAPDLIVVDPPRAGLGSKVTAALGKIRPRHITYVSCDPATLSRDLAALLESGYRLSKMHLVDLFPQTFHLESVIQLSLG